MPQIMKPTQSKNSQLLKRRTCDIYTYMSHIEHRVASVGELLRLVPAMEMPRVST